MLAYVHFLLYLCIRLMKHYLSIVFTLFLLVACDPAAELGTPFHKGQEVVLTAAIGEQRPQMMPQKYPQSQRISGKDSDTTIDLLWDEGDEIRVCVGETSSIFTLIDGAGTANASFKGTMPASGSSFEVSYPVDYSDTILQQQTYVPKGIAKGLMKMSTTTPGTLDGGFTLKAEHAVLGLQLTGNSEIGKLVLTKNGTDGKAAKPSYTLNCTSSGVTLTDSPTLFYIVLPTGTWEHGFTVTVYAADNTTIIDSLVTTKTFTFESTNATMMAAKEVTVLPEYVDLGLSVKWATFNIGATSPEEYGDYFAWGETEQKEIYNWATYKWCDGASNRFTKYCSNSQYGADGFIDYKTTLDPEDDAAIQHLGGYWRMPTREEWLELRKECSWKKITINNKTGYQVTGKNGNSIFLPRAGLRMSNIQYATDSVGYYASSSHLPRFLEEDYAAYMLMYDNSIGKSSAVRHYGLTIRPVYDDRPYVPSKRIGIFSVAADKHVSFSQGNLQYTQSTLTWQFASEQYEVIGADNIQDSKLADRIDLFGWSANNNTAPFGVSTSTTAADYAGDFVDWGVNTISGDAPNTWRTLSADEWDYLISHRPHANDLHTKGSVEGAKGLIILPDNWLAQTGIALTPVADDANLAPGVNAFTADQWQQMEQAGAVFLPAAGVRVGLKEVKDVAIYGGYWSDTPNQEGNILLQSFHVAPCNYTDYSYRSYGRSVRLVHDTILPMP